MKKEDFFSLETNQIEERINESSYQHKRILNIILKISNQIKLDSTKSVIETLLEELLFFSKYHFKYEENMLNYLKISNDIEYIKSHESLISELNNLVLDYYINNDHILEIAFQLIKWHIKHINLDLKISNYILRSHKL